MRVPDPPIESQRKRVTDWIARPPTTITLCSDKGKVQFRRAHP